MGHHKWIDLGIRTLGLVLLYFFFTDMMTIANLLIGYGELRSHALEGTVLHGILDMLAGFYLAFYPKKILALITRDGIGSEAIDFEENKSYPLIFEVGLKLFGVYLFYQFMYYMVTVANVAMGNFAPGNVESAGYFVQAVFHLISSLLLLSKTKQVVGFLLGKK